MVTLDDIEAQREIVNELFEVYYLMKKVQAVSSDRLLEESQKLEKMMEEYMRSRR